MSRRIVIDRSRCGATGNCVFWAPHTFELDGEGVAIVMDPDGDSREHVEQAAANCPLLAIAIEDEG